MNQQQRVTNITQNVQGETENMRHKFTNLEQNLKDLSSGGLFGQIETMISELKRLTEINERYELRYFLLCTELERRGRIVEEYWGRIQFLEKTLQEKEIGFTREIERIREEEVNKMRRSFELEFSNLKTSSEQERIRLDRRIQELQGELSRRDAELEEMRRRGGNYETMISSMKMEHTQVVTRLTDQLRSLEDELNRTRGDNAQQVLIIETRYTTEIESLKRQFASDMGQEVEKQKRAVSEFFSQQLTAKEADLARVVMQFEAVKMRVADLERENQGLAAQLEARVRETNELRDQLVAMKRSFDEQTIRITETHRIQITKAIGDKEKEMRDRLELELSKIEKELKEKKTAILALEQKIIFMEKENQRNSSRLSDMTVERDELKSRLIDAEKRLNEEIRIVEETLTVQVQERESEIERLMMQNRELNDMYSSQLEQEKGRVNGLLVENDMLKKEMTKLRELSEQRNREIEEWRVKYRGYITGEE